MDYANEFYAFTSGKQTRTVTFRDTGDTWTYHCFVSMGLAREWVPMAMAALKPDQEGLPQVDLTDPLVAQQVTKLNDLLLQRMTVEWSYGPNIDDDTINNLVPLQHYAVMMKLLEEVIIPLVEQSLRAVPSGFSLPSSAVLVSPMSG